MIGAWVEHPQYGRGQVTEMYRNGAEWVVRFESGLRFRRPRQEFNGQHAPSPAPAFLSFAPAAPMLRSQFAARQLVEALRFGVAPAQYVRELTIGLEAERASLIAGLNQSHQEGGAVRAVIGDYGFGKSHIVELTAQEALARNFLVATVSLDLLELPPHRSFDIYAALMRSLLYPQSDERGLGPLLEQATETPRVADQLRHYAPVEWDPIVATLEALGRTTSTRQRAAWQQWLMGARKAKGMGRALARGAKIPSIYTVGNNARQMAYLLSGVSVLARRLNYSGLCILIDEAESYSLLSPAQRPKASLFFQAMIYAALREQQRHIGADTLPQHRWRDYPLSYGDEQSLFFLFTVTSSENRLPLEAWLEPEQVLVLDPHHTPQEVGQFLQQVQQYHAQAYDYEPGERQGQFRRAGAEQLAQGMRNGRLSIRGAVRLVVELFDLLYLYPQYDTATLLDELRRQMQAT